MDILKSFLTVCLVLVNGFVFAQYNAQDLQEFLSYYGTKCEDYVPMYNNYFQDASGNTAKWQYVGEGKATWIIERDSIQGNELIFTTYNRDGTIKNDAFEYGCNGSLFVTIEVEYKGCKYERSSIGYAHRNPCPLERCGSILDVTPSGNFWAGQFLEFEPFEFLVEGSKWDLNDDYKVDSADMLIILQNYNR